MKNLCENSQLPQQVDYFHKKGPTTDPWLDCCKCWMQVDWKCMEFVTAGWCTVKQLRLDQTIGNMACGDSTGSNQIEKDMIFVLPGCVWGKEGSEMV